MPSTTTTNDGTDLPNYHAIDPPHDRSPESYDTDERRAEVLEFVLSAGGPTHVNQTELAGRYDVAQSTISRDIDVLGEAVSAHLDDHLKLATRALHDRLVTDLSEADDWRAQKAAWDVHMEYVAWAGVEPASDPEQGPGTPSASDHELTDQQRDHLRQLKEQARMQMVTRDDTPATVPDAASDSLETRQG